MGYKLRLVQSFDKGDAERFLKIEEHFARLERAEPGMRRGRRYVPVMGRMPTNTLVWEAHFDTLDEVNACLKAMEESDGHETLFKEQVRYMRDAWVEVYQELAYDEEGMV